MNFLRDLIPLLKIMRLHNAVGCGLVLLAGQSTFPGIYWKTNLGSAFAVGLLCVAAHLANDLVDLPADRTNRPKRPLPEGRLSLHMVRIAMVATLISGFVLGVALNPAWLPWWVFWSIAGIGYSLWAKGRGVLAPLWTALVITSCLIPGMLEKGLSKTDVVVIAFMFWYLVFREFVKYLADFRGDCLAGYRPLSPSIVSLYHKTFMLGLPLAFAALYLLMKLSIPLQRSLGLILLICIGGALAHVLKRLQPRPHLAGSFLKAGAFSGLALLFLSAP